MKRTSVLLTLIVALGTRAPAHPRQDASAAPEAGVFLATTLADVAFDAGSAPDLARAFGAFELRGGLAPRVRLESVEEAYLGLEWREPWGGRDLTLGECLLAARALEAPAELHGVLWLPEGGAGPPRAHRFTWRSPEAGAEGRARYLRARALHYAWLAARDLPGAAWFRHRDRVARAELARETDQLLGFDPQDSLASTRRRRTDVDQTYALFSGGQALAENLALSAILEPDAHEGDWVPVEEIAGITVAPMEYPPAGPDVAPVELDPLARKIPLDQHALFFPSFASLVRVVDEVSRRGAPVLELLDARSQDARTRERYERQLCLSLDAAARAFGGALIESVAITGGDPYLRTGSDVTIVLRTPQPRLLEAFLDDRYAEAEADAGAVRERRALDGFEVVGVRTPDRSISSWRLRLGDDVVVSNSIAGLARLVDVARGERKSLAEAPELAYFRERYRRGEPEDLFLVLSDETIRRWCGPEWRIGCSRRVRAAALVAEEHARELEARLAGAPLAAGVVMDVMPLPGGGALRRTERGLLSDVYGGERFQTPIVELGIQRVTTAEREAYGRFRDGYERRWRQVFDPIAARLVVGDEGLDLDLSIVPLALQSEYRDLRDLSRGATLGSRAADPHAESLVHFALALGRDSRLFSSSREYAQMIAPGLADPLAWVGPDVSIWYDRDDALLAEMEEAAGGAGGERALERFWSRMPIGFRLASTDPLRLAAFLTGLRSMVDTSGPGLVRFETREHAGRGYVAVLPESLDDVMGTELELYYASFSDAFVASLREEVVQRAIERDQARRSGAVADEASAPWLGESAGLRLSSGFQGLVALMVGDEWRKERAGLAWSTLPILDEWRRLGVADPLAFHAREWGIALVCPDRGRFEWDEQLGAHVSTVFGHPARPIEGPLLPEALRELGAADMGLTFVDGGVRARVRLR